MSKLPAILFYPSDWRSDPGVQSLCFHDRGVWFEILCLMHESEERGKLLLNGNPMPDDALARLLGLDKQSLTNTITTILTYGVASRDQDTGALMNRRMVSDEKLRKTRSECGKMGGNPSLVKQNTTKVNDVHEPNNESSHNQTIESVNENVNLFKKKLSEIYKRPEGQAWTHFEESQLVEISKRLNVTAEFELIAKYRASLKPEDKKFFPRSVSALLAKWDEVLDASRVLGSQSARPSHVPSQKQVEDYAKQKCSSEAEALSLAGSFFRYWNDSKRNWMEQGKSVDWQISLSEYITRKRQKI